VPRGLTSWRTAAARSHRTPPRTRPVWSSSRPSRTCAYLPLLPPAIVLPASLSLATHWLTGSLAPLPFAFCLSRRHAGCHPGRHQCRWLLVPRRDLQDRARAAERVRG
jgi:hypothetical protein